MFQASFSEILIIVQTTCQWSSTSEVIASVSEVFAQAVRQTR